MEKNVFPVSGSVYWTGPEKRKSDCLDPNVYIIKTGDDAVLVNTGPYFAFEEIRTKINSVINIKKISLIVITSTAADCSSSLPLFLREAVNARVAVHWRGAKVLAESCRNADYFIINENRWEFDTSDGNKLLFLPASNLYTPEEIQLYYVREKVFFSSSLFSSFSGRGTLFVEKEDIELLGSYQEHYFSDPGMIRSVIEKIKQFKIDCIAPARGGIINNEIPYFFNEISRIECGSFKGIERKEIKDDDYFDFCRKLLIRLITIYSFDQVKTLFLSAGIEIDSSGKISGEKKYRGELLWEKVFDIILSGKGISWLSIAESFVRKISKQYQIPYPSAFRNILINLKSKEIALDKDAVRLHGTKNRMRRELEETEESLTRCPVTGLKNEIFFRNYMAKEISAFLKTETNSSILMISLDNIMDLNARYGREGGDEALRGISYQLKNYIAGNYSRVAHYVFKLNSAVFAYYIPDCTDQKALEIAEEIRSDIADSSSFLEKITVSIGVLHLHEYFNESVSPPEIVTKMIDSGFSRIQVSKKSGGNTISDKAEDDGEFVRVSDPILIIDPDTKYVELLTSSLREMGFTSEVVSNGNDALKIIRKRLPQVIISETMVPGVNGFAIRETMLSDSNLSRIPFIFASHKKNEQYIEKAVKLNVLYFFNKPYSIIELTGLIDNLVKKETGGS